MATQSWQTYPVAADERGADGKTRVPDSTASPTSGVADKFDAGKLPIHLITPEMIEALASRLAFGAEKYSPRNWEQGIAYSRCFAAAMRHLWAWHGGQDFDGFEHNTQRVGEVVQGPNTKKSRFWSKQNLNFQVKK